MRFLVNITAILMFPIFGFAQTWELGVQYGPSNYQGDLAQDVNFSETHMSGGLFLKKNSSQFFAHSFSIMQGEISGNDNNYANQKIRNLSFKTDIYEFSYQLEFNFFPFGFGLGHKDFTPYVFTGLSFFYFDPVATLNGQTYKLNEFDTEGKVAGGENKNPYSNYQFAIPVGGGLKFSVSKKVNIGFNIGFRSVFSDYLDDVSSTYFDKAILLQKNGEISVALSDRSGENGSTPIGYMGKQRGRSDQRDWYVFSGVTISIKIRDSVCYRF